jgi:glycerol uptake facilitator-like aquaporin
MMKSNFSTLQKIAAEFFGTLIFFFIIQNCQQKGFIEMGYFISSVLFSAPTGAHFNPSVTLASMILETIHTWEGLVYIATQLLGGFVGNLFNLLLSLLSIF